MDHHPSPMQDFCKPFEQPEELLRHRGEPFGRKPEEREGREGGVAEEERKEGESELLPACLFLLGRPAPVLAACSHRWQSAAVDSARTTHLRAFVVPASGGRGRNVHVASWCGRLYCRYEV